MNNIDIVDMDILKDERNVKEMSKMKNYMMDIEEFCKTSHPGCTEGAKCAEVCVAWGAAPREERVVIYPYAMPLGKMNMDENKNTQEVGGTEQAYEGA